MTLSYAKIVRTICGFGLACGLLVFASVLLQADPVRVRYVEGTEHGFLVLRSAAGQTLASGDLIQVLKGNRLTAHLVFRFKDGSLSDETSVFTQHTYFRLVSNRLIQKGPAFPKSSDVSINTQTRTVRVTYSEHERERVEVSHMDLPADLANGIILNLFTNIDPHTAETTVSYLATTPKPRLVKLLIKPRGEEAFSVAGIRHAATHFTAKIELGGIEGLLAPLMGKEPSDIQVWVAGGESPAFVRAECPLFLGGPNWTIEMTSAVWQKEADRR